MIRHFLTLSDLRKAELLALIDDARRLKSALAEGHRDRSCLGKVLAMLFAKSSTRTRVAFETAMVQMGGHAIFLSAHDTQSGRGEPAEDTARVLSRMVDIIMLRTHSHAELATFANYASIPVINGLSDSHHPCQVLADIQTYMEHRGPIEGRKVAWFGDGNNMCHSWIEAAGLLGFELAIACPPAYPPDAAVMAAAGGQVTLTDNPKQAARGADLLLTDVWTSMGQEEEARIRQQVFAPFQVNSDTMQQAATDALFMHCLPAHRGEEVTAEVIDGPQSVVWDEAGNRLHAHKALLRFLLGNGAQ